MDQRNGTGCYAISMMASCFDYWLCISGQGMSKRVRSFMAAGPQL